MTGQACRGPGRGNVGQLDMTSADHGIVRLILRKDYTDLFLVRKDKR